MIREDIIINYIKGKDVLDIGSVGQINIYTLWNAIKKYPKSIIGIDVLDNTDKDIVQGNMETYSFNKKFDVIIAGDVLEHVDNQGLFLNNVRKHLKDDGYFILTTPNVRWITTFILKVSPTHLLWHDKTTLSQVLERNGFKIEYFRYYYGNKLYLGLIKRIIKMRTGMLAICKKTR